MPRQKTGKDIQCEVCTKVFYLHPGRLNKNKHHTCSKVCSGILSSKLYNTKEKYNCVNCHKEIFYKKSHAKQVKFKTCSMECNIQIKKLTNKGNNNPNSLKLTPLEKFMRNRIVAIKRRCVASNTFFDNDLDYKYLVDLYEKQNGCCHYSGIKMDISGKVSEKGNTKPTAMSVDRIIPEKGYTKDNLVLCLNSINLFKGNQDMSLFRDIIEGLMLNIKEKFPMKVMKLSETSKLPTKGDHLAAGIDLYTDRIEDCGHYIKVFSGIAIEPKLGYFFMLAPRSSAHKKGLTMFNNLGIIDNNYRGEIIGLFLKTDNFVMPEIGERLMQLIPQKQIWVEMQEVDKLSETDRGNKGFGSTGVK